MHAIANAVMGRAVSWPWVAGMVGAPLSALTALLFSPAVRWGGFRSIAPLRIPVRALETSRSFVRITNVVDVPAPAAVAGDVTNCTPGAPPPAERNVIR